MAKILALDIEWKPAVAYVWRMWDENISPEQLIDDGGLLCFAAEWIGTKEKFFFSEWEDGAEQMAYYAHRLLTEADAVVTYNGDKYDIPKLRGHLLLNGYKDVPPITSIDLIKPIKKLGFVMNKLAYIAPLLEAGKKLKHEGFALWRSVLEGDPKAQKRMEQYCVQDVKVLVDLYERVKPFIHNHPHLGENKGECGACGSSNVQLRGWRRSKFFKTRRLQCSDCGGWSIGTRVKVGG